MPRWAAFAGITAAVLVILIALARTSQAVLPDDGPDDRDGREGPPGSSNSPDVASTDSRDLPTRVLLWNVALSQGILWALLLAGAWYAEVPAGSLGIRLGGEALGGLGVLGGIGAFGGIGTLGGLGTQVVVGLGFGLAIAIANTVGAAAAGAFGFDPSEELRELLAPETVGEWLLLLVVVLPVIAGFEEFLFRASIVGALSVGFGVSPWLLAVVSSVLFALGHGAQGTLGVVVTGVLGFVLAAGFVLTGSLLVVVVAHYLVNAAEFVVYEGLDADPLGSR